MSIKKELNDARLTLDEMTAELDRRLIARGLAPTIPDNSKVGQVSVTFISKRPKK